MRCASVQHFFGCDVQSHFCTIIANLVISGSSVGDSVLGIFWESVVGRDGSSVKGSIGNAVGNSVRNFVRDSVKDSDGSSVRSSVVESTENSV